MNKNAIKEHFEKQPSPTQKEIDKEKAHLEDVVEQAKKTKNLKRQGDIAKEMSEIFYKLDGLMKKLHREELRKIGRGRR